MEKIQPYLSEKPWAGEFLAKFYNSDIKNIGEAWLLSTLKDGESLVAGKKLSEYLGKELPFLIKIIDAAEPLSVQVHPNDEWAQKLENSRGKTECWLILESKPGSGVYLGLKDDANLDAFKEALQKNESVESFMKFFPTERGDFISVPAGTIHAIGGGVTLLEVQQSSGITYRLWDWNRPAREMHVEKGLKVSNFTPGYGFRKKVIDMEGVLLKHSDFECYLNTSEGEGWFVDLDSYEVHFGDSTESETYIFVR